MCNYFTKDTSPAHRDKDCFSIVRHNANLASLYNIHLSANISLAANVITRTKHLQIFCFIDKQTKNKWSFLALSVNPVLPQIGNMHTCNLSFNTSSASSPGSAFWKILTCFNVSKWTWMAISALSLSGNASSTWTLSRNTKFIPHNFNKK